MLSGFQTLRNTRTDLNYPFGAKWCHSLLILQNVFSMCCLLFFLFCILLCMWIFLLLLFMIWPCISGFKLSWFYTSVFFFADNYDSPDPRTEMTGCPFISNSSINLKRHLFYYEGNGFEWGPGNTPFKKSKYLIFHFLENMRLHVIE